MEESLKKYFHKNFLMGVAVSNASMKQQESLIASHFDSLTCENVMKFEELHPEEMRYDFAKADEIVAYAKKHQLTMRGHTLVWHNQTGDWIFRDENGNYAKKEQIMSRLKEHIDTVLHRYQDTVYCWDVVNEAISDQKDEYLRKSKWLESCGPDFIHEAFCMAHEADPKAVLFYNDYNATTPEKRDKIIRLIKELKEKGTPIHGVGLQGHFNIHTPKIEVIREAIESYAKLDLQIQFTELDVSLFAFEDHSNPTEPTAEMLELQGKYYEDLFHLFKEYDQYVRGVTLWGITDATSWLNHFPVPNRKNWPLLFDEFGKEKECLHRILKS